MNTRQTGFTLVEIAIVLLIVTILLGYSVALFPIQQELKQYRQVDAEMDSIIEQLIGFAQVNGRLPCPDTDNDGLENRVLVPPISCAGWFGFVPARTLGMNGKYNAFGVLVDPWGLGYGYAVSAGDGVVNLDVDLVTANGIRDEGMANVTLELDLFICDDSNAAGNDLDCSTVSGDEVIGSPPTGAGVAAVITSLGKRNEIPAISNIEIENQDDFTLGTSDKVYIFAPRSDTYDDIVKWIPASLLFSRMIEADQLP